VLDAACGNGYGSRILADAGAHVLGVDVAPDAVAFARHYFGGEHMRFAAAAIDDGRSLRLAAERRGPFDAVVTLETLEHLERPEVFLRDAAALLRAGGDLFCSTPNAEVMDLAEAPFHRRHFQTGEALALLDACGFVLIGWFGQEGMQILPGRCTPRQRYCLYHARRR
jgi:2-polyprenyl-3-methyl-5-hydroxy-6-metoxy-1,4-benzoquinol methylase